MDRQGSACARLYFRRRHWAASGSNRRRSVKRRSLKNDWIYLVVVERRKVTSIIKMAFCSLHRIVEVWPILDHGVIEPGDKPTAAIPEIISQARALPGCKATSRFARSPILVLGRRQL
jgi:hypothetical protein